MQIILKTKGNQPIDNRDSAWVEAKFKKLGRFIPIESVVEITLEDLYGAKGGVDKKIHVLTELPHTKQPFYLEEVSTNFRAAAIRARDRFLRHLKKYRDRVEIGNRFPRKYWINRVFDRLLGRPKLSEDEYDDLNPKP